MRWIAFAGALVLAGCTTEEEPPPAASKSQPPKADAPLATVPDGDPTKPFLGLPDDQERKIETGQLRGITTITKVQLSDYMTYLDLKGKGRIKAEEQRGNVIYYAVEHHRDVRFPNPGPGEPISAWVTMTERYKTEVPKK